MLIWAIHILYILVAVSKCSQTLHKHNQKSTNKYCGRIGACKPGEHVMCMYNTTGSTMAPKCTGAPIPINKKDRLHILQRVNRMRRELTNGVTVVKNITRLPKAYGLKVLEWNNELAKLAQVWANQCNIDNGDHCRATKKFPNPGQFMGGIRSAYYTEKDEDVITMLNNSISMMKRRPDYVIDMVMNVVDEAKNDVTPDMVSRHVGNGHNNPWTLVVYGKTTHIGCAMSTWVNYIEPRQPPSKGYNLYSTLLVCNLSSQPAEGEKVYETDPNKALLSNSKPHSKTQKRAVAKTESTMKSRGYNHNQVGNSLTDHSEWNKPSTAGKSQINNRRKLDVKDRYINRKEKKSGQGNPRVASELSSKIPRSKKHESIFTRVSKFELPSQHFSETHEEITKRNEISFARRSDSTQKLSKKDLSDLEKLISEYFIKKRRRPDNSPVNVLNPLINTLMKFLDTHPTINDVETVNANNRRMREMSVSNSVSYNSPAKGSKNSHEVIDKKLFNFLHNLVQVSGVDFNEIIDATTRIIQGDKGNLSEKMEEHKIPNIRDRTVKTESEFTPFVPRRQNPLIPHGKEIFGSIKNNYYAVDNAAGANTENYFQPTIETSERNPRNTRNYRRHSYQKMNFEPLFRPVINI